MNVFHFDLADQMRGGQRQVYYLATYQQAQFEAGLSEFCPIVLCPQSSALAKELETKNVQVCKLSTRNFANPLLFFEVRQAIKKYQPQILHSHEARAANLAYFCKKYLAKNTKLVHTRRVSYLIRRGSHSKKYLASDALVCVSKEIADLAVDMFIPEKIVHTIHSGIEPSIYQTKLAKTNKRFIFVSVGALTKQKGFDILLEAMQIIDKMRISSLPVWELRIVGQGELFDTLFEQAQNIGVLDHTSFLGYQDSKDILPYCDALISCSVEGEGSSGVIKEAFAVGLPLICTDLPSNKELVENNVNGLVVQTANAEALAGAMIRLMHEEKLTDELVANGKIQLENFTVEKMGQSYHELYQKILNT